MDNSTEAYLAEADRILAESGLANFATYTRAAVDSVVLEVSDLTEEDVNAARVLMSTGASMGINHNQPIQNLRANHHRMAQMIAAGMEDVTVAKLCARSPHTVKVLRNDPAFQELIAHYSAEVDSAFVDFVSAAATLSLDMLQHLGEQLEANPGRFDPRTTLEAIKVLADRTGHAPVSKTVNVDINLDLAKRMKAAETRLSAQPALIEGTVIRESEQ